MTGARWRASALILFHVVAVSVAIIPAPGEIDDVGPPRSGMEGDPVSTALTPWFDRAARVVLAVETVLHDVLRPIRRITEPYVKAGVKQSWRMFSTPPTEDRYIRLDYYTETSPQAPLLVLSEIVLLVPDGESLRYFRGKAIRNALDTYLHKDFAYVGTAAPGDAEVDAARYEDLIPLVRHFRKRFARTRAETSSRIIRTELWFGRASMAPPGQRLDETVLKTRRMALESYGRRPPRNHSRLILPRRGAVHRELDLTWSLEYVE